MDSLKFDVLVIGAGPAGIFTALELNKLKPEQKVLIIDMGRGIEKRVCPERTQGFCSKCKVCSITSGWSGAGAFSDGKLSLSPEVGGRITEYMTNQQALELIHYADQYYLDCGANGEVFGLNNQRVEDIAYEARKNQIRLVPCPVRHLGTERAYQVLKEMYHRLEQNPNFTFWELTKAEDLLVKDQKAIGAIIHKQGQQLQVLAKHIVVAPGRGGAQWLKEQTDKLNIKTVNNEVDIGVRVEVSNGVMDHLTKDLYEAKLVYYSDTYENKVRTFCMNPGGVVSGELYDDDHLAVVNGHSYGDAALKTQNTNFAILVSTHFTEPFNQPIEYGKYIARLANMLTGGGIMVQRLGDLLKGRRTTESRLAKSSTIPTMKGAVPGDLSYVLPERYLSSIVEALRAFDKIAPGLYGKDTLLYGVEVKFYSSKLQVGQHFETEIENLYAIGDGAGITRGLMQASATGIVVARDIASHTK